MTLGEFCTGYRKEHDLSVRSFAAMVNMSPQQIINIEKGIGNDGKPMTSTMKTYTKIANGVGMEEQAFMKMLNDNVIINPEIKNPATDGDGNEKETIVLSELSEKQQRLIRWILKLSDREASDLLPKTEEFLSDQQVQGDQ